MKNRKVIIAFLVIILFYLFTRTYLVLHNFDENVDYDEGTYLLIARLINQGYLPYRDIFAVHPPLYYYILALIFRLFGDNYISGRLFSVSLGFVSLILAYYIGREVKNEKLGIIFAGFLAMNPILLFTNFLAVQETFIEFFVLFSLYYFIKYLKTTKEKYAYLSLFLVGLGSTVKFTIIPYAISIYLALLIFKSKKLHEYLAKTKQILLNKEQIKVITIAYILMILIASSIFILLPIEATKEIMVVPGFYELDNFYQILPSILLILIWLIFTTILFRLRFISTFLKSAVLIIRDIKEVLKYGAILLLPKIIIEGLFGLFITPKYISQTYLIQGTRMLPIVNLFWYIGSIIHNISSGELDDLLFMFPLFLLLLFTLIVSLFKISSQKSAIRQKLTLLFLVSFFVYFFIAPIVPFEKFLIPMWVILYLILLDFLLSVKLTKKQAIALVLAGVLFLSIADFGIIYRYSKQRAIIRKYGGYSKELRDELSIYLKESGIEGKFYSANPMNTYYLNLNTTPKYLDLYGLIVLKDMNEIALFSILREENIDYFICSSWCYIVWSSQKQRERLKAISTTLLNNHTIIYASAYRVGDIIELYKLEESLFPIKIKSYSGNLLLSFNGTLGELFVNKNNISYNFKTKIVKIEQDTYKITQYSDEANSIEFSAILSKEGIKFEFINPLSITLRFFTDISLLDEDNTLIKTGETRRFDSLIVIIGDQKIKIDGENLIITKISGREIRIHGKEVKFSMG